MATRGEIAYQGRLIKKLERIFSGAIVFRGPCQEIQGIPDIIILLDGFWAALEVKESASSDYEPNQEWYLDRMHTMSFASVIYPEIEKEVLDALQTASGARR
jgi:hypothetical protein